MPYKCPSPYSQIIRVSEITDDSRPPPGGKLRVRLEPDGVTFIFDAEDCDGVCENDNCGQNGYEYAEITGKLIPLRYAVVAGHFRSVDEHP